MPTDLFAEAGNNFKGVADTAIRSQEAQTQKSQVSQQGASAAGVQVGETLRQAMGDKEKMKELQQTAALNIQTELLKKQMNTVKFPPSLAIHYAQKYKQPELLQLSGQEMPFELSHAIMDSLAEKRMKAMVPKIAGNMLIYEDENGNLISRDLTKEGFIFPPKSTPSNPPESRDRQNFIGNYEKAQADLRADEKRLSFDPNDTPLKAKVEKSRAWLSDNRPKYDKLTSDQATSGGYKPPEVTTADTGGGDEIDQLFSEASQGTPK